MKKLISAICLCAIFLNSYGQDLAPVTNKIFIQEVSIMVKPGASPFVGAILVEDGIILQVGSSIRAPYDAKVIKGDSMHVYAGFIAPLSHIGLKKTKEDSDRPKVKRPGYPPNDVAGITPEQSIKDLYNAKEGSISDYRKQGFTIAMTVPYGKMMPGMGSVFSLNGLSFSEAVIEKDDIMFGQWKPSQGMFPGTTIGIMAKWREMYRNAQLGYKHESNYNSNPRNRKRPSQDAATAALYPVVNNKMPVFFTAEGHRDVYRTLRLKKDLGFDLVIGEVRDVNRLLSAVKSSGAKILLSLDLPEEERKNDKDKKEKEETDKEKADKDLPETEKDEGEKEGGAEEKKEEMEKPKNKEEIQKEALKRRKAEAITRYTNQAKFLADYNIPVAFSYMETKAKEVHSNLRRLIKEDLSESVALGALTTVPAAILGISDIVGTIESGKIANLVMSTGPLFDDKSKIRMVMVDGIIHKYEVKEKKKKTSEGESVDVSGEWSYVIDVPGMTPTGTMTFTKNGDTYDIAITSNQSPGEPVSANGIDFDNNNMIFNYKVSTGGMDLSIDNDITFDEGSFEGTVSVGEFGTFDITGEKITPE